MKDSKVGLVLEGGAMRGLFSSGVMDVLMEHNISFDGAIGVSAGAAFGCNYKSKQIGRALRYNKRFAGDKRYCSLDSLLKTGNLYNAKFCYDTIPNELDLFDYETYKKNPMEFWIVASDVHTGNAVYKKLKTCSSKDFEWMRASASMPLASKIVKVDGFELLDGGMTDSIPLKKFQSMGYEKNVVILTQPRGFIKKKNSLMWLMRIALHRYPALVTAMAQRHVMYNDETDYVFDQEKKGNVFVICPDESLGISRTEKNPDELQRVYDMGRTVALQNINRIKSFVE
ncbi:MAG: patatin family protein [Treponema sp.]|nr:patatin family protein [Treponema sp.]